MSEEIENSARTLANIARTGWDFSMMTGPAAFALMHEERAKPYTSKTDTYLKRVLASDACGVLRCRLHDGQHLVVQPEWCGKDNLSGEKKAYEGLSSKLSGQPCLKVPCCRAPVGARCLTML